MYVKKDVKDTGSVATRYGNLVHKAAEEYIKDGSELPKKYDFMQRTLDTFNNIKGDKHCEIRLGVAKYDDVYEPTKFFAKNVWYRGIADLLIINEDKAYLIDYKTGKSANYADTKQLDLLAGAVFINFPEVKKINTHFDLTEHTMFDDPRILQTRFNNVSLEMPSFEMLPYPKHHH